MTCHVLQGLVMWLRILVHWLLLLGTPATVTLPPFSWDVIPLFMHAAKPEGSFSSGELQKLMRFSMITLEKAQGEHNKCVHCRGAALHPHGDQNQGLGPSGGPPARPSMACDPLWSAE